ncbi:MAG: hypothetical protein OEY11_06670 [Gammaproteobacteria bacterium]|nr:hypothetical protein [Gammaproteobacteria bacterium]
MSVIRVSHVKAGQIILSDVKDRSGRVLLPAGSELTHENIKIIKSWGVAEADVDADLHEPATRSDFQLADIDSKQLEHVEIVLAKRFRFLNKNHPFTEELYRLCLRRELLSAGLIDD